MALRIRYAGPPGLSLGYSIERLRDGLFYDFSVGTFSSAPVTLVNALTAVTGNYNGLYKDTIATTPVAQFTDGQYAVFIHNTASANAVAGVTGATMVNGDDAPLSDPWSVRLPGAYAGGTAGGLVGTNLDTNVGSRSTYSGGPVAGVTTPVTVGTNNDKTGYTLAAGGLDSVVVEAGVNVRQALSPILAAAAGVLSGAGTGTIVVKGGNVATTRILATTDSAGNRASVVLTLPT